MTKPKRLFPDGLRTVAKHATDRAIGEITRKERKAVLKPTVNFLQYEIKSYYDPATGTVKEVRIDVERRRREKFLFSQPIRKAKGFKKSK